MTEFRIPGLQMVADPAVFRKRLARSPGHTIALAAGLLYLALESYYLFFRFAGHMQDLLLYQGTAMRLLGGEVPFRDFRLEYPVFSLVPIVLPGILSSLAGGSFKSYVFWFVVQNLALGLGMAAVIAKMDTRGKVLPKYLMAMLFSLPVFLFRFDTFPALLTIVAVYYISQKPFVSGMSLLASVAAKLYSIVLVPVFGWYYLFQKEWKKLGWQIAGFVAAAAILAGCIAAMEMNAASDFMRYHLLRGIQIESLAGGMLMLLESFGLIELDIAHSFGAIHLITPLTAGILGFINITTPICFLAMTAYLGWAFHRASAMPAGLQTRRLIASCGAQILLFMLLNKVFSPQYMIWLLPLVPFCKARTHLLFTVALMLTVVIFPGQYHNLLSKQWPMVIILNARNALLIWLFVEMLGEINPVRKLAGRNRRS
ncbi:hypothetical protein [Dyadobacter beijingensis]|nr:hypothetical protein [Dyadobacter beijingensis]